MLKTPNVETKIYRENVNFDSILTPVLRSVQEIQLGTSGL